MSTIRLWNLGSNAYAQTTESIRNELENHLPLENLSIRASERRALQKRIAKDMLSKRYSDLPRESTLDKTLA